LDTRTKQSNHIPVAADDYNNILEIFSSRRAIFMCGAGSAVVITGSDLQELFPQKQQILSLGLGCAAEQPVPSFT